MWRTSDIEESHSFDSEKFNQVPIEPFINSDLNLKINELQDFDENRIKKIEYWDEANTSELARIFENADERDLLTVCYVAVRRNPVKYLTVLMDYILEKEGPKCLDQ